MLWEVYSNGSAPYPGMSNHDARSQVRVHTCNYNSWLFSSGEFHHQSITLMQNSQ